MSLPNIKEVAKKYAYKTIPWLKSYDPEMKKMGFEASLEAVEEAFKLGVFRAVHDKVYWKNMEDPDAKYEDITELWQEIKEIMEDQGEGETA